MLCHRTQSELFWFSSPEGQLTQPQCWRVHAENESSWPQTVYGIDFHSAIILSLSFCFVEYPKCSLWRFLLVQIDRQARKRRTGPIKQKGILHERVLQRKFCVQLSSINVKVASLVINLSQTKFMYLYLYFSPQTHMNTKSISTVLTLSAHNELCCCVFSVLPSH